MRGPLQRAMCFLCRVHLGSRRPLRHVGILYSFNLTPTCDLAIGWEIAIQTHHNAEFFD